MTVFASLLLQMVFLVAGAILSLVLFLLGVSRLAHDAGNLCGGSVFDLTACPSDPPTEKTHLVYLGLHDPPCPDTQPAPASHLANGLLIKGFGNNKSWS